MSHLGQQIGRYRILEQLGSGGMSVVYKGLDTALDREVAVKVLHPHLAGKDESRRRLAREAKAVAKLHHPNILEVFDFSPAGAEEAYIVTEYIRGQTLRVCMETLGFEPPEVAALIIHELAAALAHAHEAGVIHRDLKPENVMVREDGVLKLMDFGIAKILDRDERMTITGSLVGSPAHMAPEIIEGQEAGAAADIFSLGTMLYAFATGKLPFSASNTTATLKRILDGHYEDPRQLAPAISDELAEIITTCLARQPQDRYPHAGRLRDALADYLGRLGLGRPSEELSAFFADPPTYRRQLRQRLVAQLLERSERLLRERPARALADLNQVLALDPEQPRALALLEGLDRARRLRRRLARTGRVGAALLALLLLTVGARALWTRHPAAPAPSAHVAARPPARAEAPPSATPAAEGPAASAPLASAPPPSPLPAAPPVRAEPPRPLARVPVSVLVRPYGVVQLDEEPPSAEALAQHNLSALPGPHRVRVSCTWCEPVVETIEVRAGADNIFRLRAQLKPSTLAFDWKPADAVVKIGDVQRTAHDSLSHPFELRSPRGPASFQHRVDYEISRPGYATEQGSTMVEPGKAETLRGALEPR
ncbi:serine/threonine protein kinase [Aggregicoccus sp. 17bor-14]|uniref:serine/threonine-protein kinase n=1 Tax=Myxococcaceae TaxID=31 RepID=UPI00129C4752|nr:MULTISPECIES: serine/threonine-protein kinase [Myxococcaceae]MBF5040994.1 serine/threonine protein kinase [Simulacricoccus sp. 17bor-14]MRI86781.1 serine/threonine protein kinase [Aggregicoccus sp. 17bor-14]